MLIFGLGNMYVPNPCHFVINFSPIIFVCDANINANGMHGESCLGSWALSYEHQPNHQNFNFLFYFWCRMHKCLFDISILILKVFDIICKELFIKLCDKSDFSHIHVDNMPFTFTRVAIFLTSSFSPLSPFFFSLFVSLINSYYERTKITKFELLFRQ